jgi:triphosphoribosyl-dephospho-CoA synthase
MNAVLQSRPLLPDDVLVKSIHSACLREVNAFKPGNVSPSSPAHDMTLADFEASAKAISHAMSNRSMSVGERILAGIKATREVTSQNTNLGIVLLFAPIISAWYERAGNSRSLHASLNQVLQQLSIEDARLTYEAIALANPGGLGQSQQHDVHSPVAVTLLEAMKAAPQDQIAQAYANHYQWFWFNGLNHWRQARLTWTEDEQAILQCFLAILAEAPDTHILRRHGTAVAQNVSARAREFLSALEQGELTTETEAGLMAWDAELKAAHINPGTSADLLATVLFMDSLLNPQG